ncbi:MAG TPA: A/G-specific adenine glycosylase [Fimbriimonadaceae bacterium]|nr:A/G-specific adenine glycosylase [Fimbriimonadaceae bacterium]
MPELQGSLLAWYEENKRDLPWRRTRDPYAVWVSEVMLQQTQIATALPYYGRWMARFPDIASLAAASEGEALALWQGLGYYRRCRMLRQGAEFVLQNGLPTTAEEWRKVPGVGRYTAGAIASICFGERSAVVDGNVKRVFARLCSHSETGAALERACWSWADEQVPADRPSEWNQALMELGATVCTPRNPKCGECPISSLCLARQQGRVAELPVRANRLSSLPVLHELVVPVHSQSVGLRQIPKGQWWEGMWSFPDALAAPAGRGFALPTIHHVVTRHKVSLRGELRLVDKPGGELSWVPWSDLSGVPMPAPHRKLLESARLECARMTSGVF